MILVTALATGKTTALTKAECAFIYDLMGQVEDDQTWGWALRNPTRWRFT